MRLVELRILGSLEVVADGRVIPLVAPKQRALLALLLLRAGEPVSRDVLVDDLWAGRPPPSAAKVLQTYVSQLRRVLGRDTIVTGPSTYELRVDAGSFDLHRFEQLVATARTTGLAKAAELLREALALWRGAPLAEFAYEPWAQPEIERLEELRLSALQARIEADLALGGSAELVAELELLVSRHPLREGLRAQLMLALYRAGRQADALAVYREARRALVETLGVEPAPALRQLERAILDQDPSLAVASVAPQTADAPRQVPRLKRRASSFLGRARELREISELLLDDHVRLLTLTGAAGSGKTRLALEVTGGLESEAAEVVLVELGRVADARFVARAIVGALGIEELPGSTAGDRLLDHLRDRRALLLLDNFEHVLSAAPLVRDLLVEAPGTRVLATSRAPLGLPEEVVYRVPALSLPDPSRHWTIERLRETEAVGLFVERARMARPDFELTETNAVAVAELCVRLDGLPLALELAAARCNVLSPRALLERLDSRLDLLRASPGAGLSERQWTLRAAIDWSYELLTPAEQQLFTSLAVFVGGFTLAAAEHVAEQDIDVLEAVESLLRNNLLKDERARSDEPRLGMLETIREYALDRLAARGDADDVRRRHVDHYVALSEEAEDALLGARQREWLELLDAEWDNIREALTWAVAAGEVDAGLRIGAALWRYVQLRSRYQEARERLQELLALGSGTPANRANAQTRLATQVLVKGDRDVARRLLEESLPVHREQGDHGLVAHALGTLGWASLEAGDTEAALALTREAHEVASGGASPYIESASLWQIGVCLAVDGRLDEAEQTIEDSIELARSLGNARSVGGSMKTLGGIALLRGDLAQARALFEESLAIHRSLGDAHGVSHSLLHLALLGLEAGESERPRELLREALAVAREQRDDDLWVANALEVSARLAAKEDGPGRALRLYARAALLREVVGTRPHYELGWPDPTSEVDRLRGRLGEQAFAVEWERGRSMSVLEAIDLGSAVSRERGQSHG